MLGEQALGEQVQVTSTLDVWLADTLIGKLHRRESGRVEFSYCADYVGELHATPLSLSMPVSRLSHGRDKAEPWIENLLPEDEKARVGWARRFGETRSDAFTLLQHIGSDAPGAVRLVPEGISPSSLGGHEELSERTIGARLREIRDQDWAWVPSTEGDVRFSLAGQQSKFAVTKRENTWLEPTGRAASTHIIKPGMQGFRTARNDDQAAEFITMRAASKLGLRVAEVEIRHFDGEPAFLTQRFDRVTAQGKVLRIHQEDLCQALAVPPTRKYENDGGPSVRDVARLIREHSSAPAQDRDFFAKALVFNLMAAGIDGHAKNYSFLLNQGKVRFAPLYDLISAHALFNADRVNYKAKMGMRYGREYRLRGIGGRNLMRTADDLGYSRDSMFELAQTVASSLPEAMAEAFQEMPSIPVTDKIRRLPETTAAFAQAKIAEIETADLHSLPKTNT